MAKTISLPDELAEQAEQLARSLDISLEELSVMALKELLKKYSRTSVADWDFEQKMAIARRGIKKYQKSLVELSK